MADREKVIDHLLIIRIWNKVGTAYAYDEIDKKEKAKTVEWIDDALELLKEKEQDIQNLIADFDDLREEHEKLLDKKIPLITSGKNVIQCKDCKYGKQLFPDYISCQISDENESGCHASHNPEWFCADGEHKEGR